MLSSTISPANKPANRLDFLDAGRGISILGVMGVHTVQNFPTGIKQLDFLISLGQFGVQLFFIINELRHSN